MLDFQRVCQERSHTAAYRMMSRGGESDIIGNTKEDYQSIFTLHFLESMGDLELEGDDLEKWGHSVIKNATFNLRRDRKRAMDFFNSNPDLGVEQVDSSQEHRIVNRDLLRSLREFLVEDDWYLLTYFLDNDCCVSDTWRQVGQDEQQNIFRYRLNRVLGRCRAYLARVK